MCECLHRIAYASLDIETIRNNFVDALLYLCRSNHRHIGAIRAKVSAIMSAWLNRISTSVRSRQPSQKLHMDKATRCHEV